MKSTLTLTRLEIAVMDTDELVELRHQADMQSRGIDCHSGALTDQERETIDRLQTVQNWCTVILNDRRSTEASVKAARPVFDAITGRDAREPAE